MVSESPSGPSAIVCAPCARVSAPWYSGRAVISTIDGVRGMTLRKSASIDSLTVSIQCASSMMNSAGAARASVAVLISAVNRRLRASASIWGGGTSGSAMPSRSSSSSRSCGSASAGQQRATARGRLRRRRCRRHRCPPAAVASRRGTGRHGRAIRRRSRTPRPHDLPPVAAASRATRLLPMPGGPDHDARRHRGHRWRGPPWRRGRPSPSADRPGSSRRDRSGHPAD